MKTWMKIISALVCTGIVAAILVWFFVYNKPHPNYEKMDAAYSVTAAELYQAFRADKTSAGNKYNGKVIGVSGSLTKVEVIDSLTICVFVFNMGMFGDEGVRCTMLPRFRDQAKSFQPEGVIKLKGYCTGFNDTDVILEKCSIEKQ